MKRESVCVGVFVRVQESGNSQERLRRHGKRLWRAIFFVFFFSCDIRDWVRRGVKERLPWMQQRAELVVDEAGVDREQRDACAERCDVLQRLAGRDELGSVLLRLTGRDELGSVLLRLTGGGKTLQVYQGQEVEVC